MPANSSWDLIQRLKCQSIRVQTIDYEDRKVCLRLLNIRRAEYIRIRKITKNSRQEYGCMNDKQ